MIETLGIRWIELLAQTISFSFVLFVLWKLAYKPVFNMLEARKAKIAEGIANAEKIKAELAHTESERKRILAQAGDLVLHLLGRAGGDADGGDDRPDPDDDAQHRQQRPHFIAAQRAGGDLEWSEKSHALAKDGR